MSVKDEISANVQAALEKMSEAAAALNTPDPEPSKVEEPTVVHSEPTTPVVEPDEPENPTVADDDNGEDLSSQIILDDDDEVEDDSDQAGKHKPIKDMTADEKAAFYKGMARKHERRARNSFAETEQLKTQLAQAQRDTALAKAKLEYPMLTDEDFALCTAPSAQGVADWAKSQAEFLARHTANNAKGTAQPDSTVQRLSHAGVPSASSVATTQDDMAERTRKLMEDKINARRNNKLFAR